MNYVVIKLINWQYSAGNTPDMKINQDETSEPMSLNEAINLMNNNNTSIEYNTPYAWSVLSEDAYKHLGNSPMYKAG